MSLVATHLSTPAAPASPSRRLYVLLYVAGWLAAGVFLAIAELQHYLRGGGRHPWEPFLWEISSSVSAGLMALLVYRWHRWLFGMPHPLALRVGGHLLGAAVYTLGHTGGMYALRWAVYAVTGVVYEPGGVGSVLAYEGSKDIVYYSLFAALSHGVWLYLREQQRREELARLSAELAASKLARLQEQVQPHFLFNTLNLISSVMYEDVARADRILCELADLLRQSLDASRTLSHPVAQELRVVAPFLSIMQQRFGERLSVRVAVSDAAAVCEIPSLLLIAPVENAVKHGVAASAGAVQIVIAGSVEPGPQGPVLSLSVTDSAGQLTRSERPGGIGLQNTRERLAALYGDAASVSLALEAGGTVLRLRLPARSSAAAEAA